MKELTPKQERFCQEYIIDHNQTQAAIRAGYSPATAKEQASRLLTKANVCERVTQLKKTQQKRTEINADEILKELHRIATADLSKAYDDSGQILPFTEMPEDVRRAISAFEMNEIFAGQGEEKTAVGFVRRIRFWDKTKALETLAKHLKLLTDKVEHSGSIDLVDRLQKARDRARDKS